MHNKDNTHLFYFMFSTTEYKETKSFVVTKDFKQSYPKKESSEFIPDKLPRQLRKK